MAEQANVPTIPSATTPTAAPNPTQVPTPSGSADNDEKFFAALGYFGPLFVIPLLVKPKSQYCKFHAKQSIALFIISILVLIVLASVPMIGSLLTLTLFAVYVLAIYQSYQGKAWAIPIVSVFAGKIDLNALYEKSGLAVSNISGLKDKAAGLADKATQAAQNLGKQEEKPGEPTQKA
ncbi:MAG: hypothetical protein AAB606_00120 [Patescibacteria group bacterium]